MTTRGYIMGKGTPEKRSQLHDRMKDAFRGVRIEQGKGYWYLTGTLVENAETTMICVARLKDLTYAGWMTAVAEIIDNAQGDDTGTRLLEETLRVADLRDAYMQENAPHLTTEQLNRMSPAVYQIHHRKVQKVERACRAAYPYPAER